MVNSLLRSLMDTLCKSEISAGRIKSRRGSTMIEAAVVFPIIVLSVLTVIYILLTMYSQAVSSAKLHLALCEAAADESECTLYGENYGELISIGTGNKTVSDMFSKTIINIGEKSGLIEKKITAEAKYTARAKGLIEKAGAKNLQDEIYIIDEEEYIRWADTLEKTIKKAVQ